MAHKHLPGNLAIAGLSLDPDPLLLLLQGRLLDCAKTTTGTQSIVPTIMLNPLPFQIAHGMEWKILGKSFLVRTDAICITPSHLAVSLSYCP